MEICIRVEHHRTKEESLMTFKVSEDSLTPYAKYMLGRITFKTMDDVKDFRVTKTGILGLKIGHIGSCAAVNRDSSIPAFLYGKDFYRARFDKTKCLTDLRIENFTKVNLS